MTSTSDGEQRRSGTSSTSDASDTSTSDRIIPHTDTAHASRSPSVSPRTSPLETPTVSPLTTPLDPPLELEPVPDRRPKSRAESPNEAAPDALFQALRVELSAIPARPRSPYARVPPGASHGAHSVPVHTRASSVGVTLPPMARTRSLPLYEPRQRRPSLSPSRSPIRPSSPLRTGAVKPMPRHSLEDARPSLTPSFMDIEIIAEDSELDIQPRPVPALDPTLYTSFAQTAHSMHRSNSGRRRPASPSHALAQTGFGASLNNQSPSPPPTAARFNEAYPPPHLTLSTSSSVPSTPTSLRSRSPSISSLETIPDTPDAEAEAARAMASDADALQLEKLRLAADEDERRARGIGGLGAGLGAAARERKRWSVCGAERRGDLDLETIWED